MAFSNLGIKDADEAKLWKQDVERLNQDVQQLLQEMGETLQQVRDDADSSIVDELYDWGTNIVKASNEVLKGMNEICNFVHGLVGKLTELLSGAANIISGNRTKASYND